MIRLPIISFSLILFLAFGLNGQNKSTSNFPGNIQLLNGSNTGLVLDGGSFTTFPFFLSTPSSLSLLNAGTTRISMRANQSTSFQTNNVPIVTLTGEVPGISSSTFMTFANGDGNQSDSWNFNLSNPEAGNG